jgi:peptidoglycan/LPS O-acetylase OafA/YrhL
MGPSLFAHVFFTIDPLIVISLIAVGMKLRKIKSESDLNHFSVENTLPLRGILALCVVVAHLQQRFPFSYFAVLGSLGAPSVAVFFFISGYGLTKSYLNNGRKYLDGFLVKRLGKILPLFIFLTCLCLELQWLYADVSVSTQLKNLFLKGSPPLDFSWFIYVIILIYVSFYIVARITSEFRFLLIGMIITCVCYISCVYSIGYGGFWYITVPSFVSGLVISRYEKQVRQFVVQYHWKTLMILILAWVGSKTINHANFFYIGHLFLSVDNCIPLFTLIIAYTIGVPKYKILCNLGKKSLSIYLFHGLYIMIAEWLHIHNFFVAAIFVIGLSVLSAFLWERLFFRAISRSL